MFDVHDVCDLIRTRITQLHEIADAEGDDADTDTAFMIRQWTRALEAVRDAAFWSDDATAAKLRAALAAFRYVQRCAGPKLDQPEADSMERGLRIVRDVILTLTTEEG